MSWHYWFCFLAEVLVRSPRKIRMFIIYVNVFPRSKYPTTKEWKTKSLVVTLVRWRALLHLRIDNIWCNEPNLSTKSHSSFGDLAIGRFTWPGRTVSGAGILVSKLNNMLFRFLPMYKTDTFRVILSWSEQGLDRPSHTREYLTRLRYSGYEHQQM